MSQELIPFRDQLRRWLGLVLLPIDQIILTLAQDLFDTPAELALAHKFALELRRQSEMQPEWRLPELAEEMKVVVKNERKFLGLSEDDTGFDPERHRGKVVVATMHKAKGLEWDRVYLLSVNNYDFPSALPQDTFISERKYIRGRLNLEAEALAQLKVVLGKSFNYEEGRATKDARLAYAAERLRLLFVGITRAKKELVITWNIGKFADFPQQEAVPLIALRIFWEENVHESSF